MRRETSKITTGSSVTLIMSYSRKRLGLGMRLTGVIPQAIFIGCVTKSSVSTSIRGIYLRCQSLCWALRKYQITKQSQLLSSQSF